MCGHSGVRLLQLEAEQKKSTLAPEHVNRTPDADIAGTPTLSPITPPRVR
jgi:hypothetical protein